MLNKNVTKGLMYSTVLSTILSIIGITLTIYHHTKVKELIINSNKTGKSE